MTSVLNKQKIRNLLECRFKDDSYISVKQLPHPGKLKHCEHAAKLIAEGIKRNQKILIVGDYDVDGITSSVIMMKFFKMIGYKNVNYVIPNRFSDGYGINKSIIEKNPADIIITVDNGISAFDCGEYCAKMGITLIITDHHIIKEKLPQANAIINPQQKDCLFPQKEICGAAVSWYLCNAIKLEMGTNIPLADLLDLVAIATIADMMPLFQINKLLVRVGLKKFQNSHSPCNILLKTLPKKSPITSQDISFYIAPLINSAGRMGDGKIAADFLLSEDTFNAQKLFYELNKLNKDRKAIAQEILTYTQNTSLICDNCIIAYGENWHEGVLGIVAANLAKNHKRPAIILSKKGDVLKGSARSYGNINLIEALQAHSDFLLEFGGHTKAVGLKIKEENLEKFFQALSVSKMPQCAEEENAEILGVIDIKDVDNELLEILEEFEPYGQGNPPPNFICENLKISSSKTIKSLHQSFELASNTTTKKAIIFFTEKFYSPNEYVNISFSLQKDNFSNEAMMILKTIQKCHL
ncbi:single-stranded-DNA-specific exonuclease RecJ [Helicobacter cappadocius]|uniref:Single-stranded-DNA-specific exonuclease RecJ n=1 Tax=Helicobacter cappadocius TaxID=3063998 RepID=A0AA90T9J1_9HELI|nr:MULTISPECIES: single-stranded-DNA-specific exonuclease RecJ [unclassified Helicobacter]MDO7252869.1 single-stranded-DNA-specific exonuclease RecJ [Helicobacter sp. faydin-H75]MDP2538912.1 single-stranded-DNA-specific exonuclease RecJ [Helicobacter sp. faydin-H76]